MGFEVGEIRRGTKIGFSSRAPFVWQACKDCGKQRWVMIRKGNPVSLRCFSCGQINAQGVHHPENGRYIDNYGYMQVRVNPDDFFFSMVKSGCYVLEHRLVMAKHLNRSLQSWEIVHHINGNRADNRIENLKIMSDIGHKQLTMLKRRIDILEDKVDEQAKLIKLLQWQIKEKEGVNNAS